jgi:hypothetical protein
MVEGALERAFIMDYVKKEQTVKTMRTQRSFRVVGTEAVVENEKALASGIERCEVSERKREHSLEDLIGWRFTYVSQYYIRGWGAIAPRGN